MKYCICTTLILLAFALESHAAFIWQVGLANDNTLTTEMDPESQADDFYYLDAGDYRTTRGYTGVSTLAFGVDRTGLGTEITADGSVTGEGFERALTTGDPTTNIFFQLSADQLSEGGLRFSADFFKPALYAATPPGPAIDAPTDITFYFNGILIGTIDDMVNTSLYTVAFSNSSVNAVVGSNVISLVRTGETVPIGWQSSYVVMDYLRLESAPEPSRALLVLLATVACFAQRRRKTAAV